LYYGQSEGQIGGTTAGGSHLDEEAVYIGIAIAVGGEQGDLARDFKVRHQWSVDIGGQWVESRHLGIPFVHCIAKTGIPIVGSIGLMRYWTPSR